MTTISNEYTGYYATIKHAGSLPAVSTVRKHLRRAKSKGCRSTTLIIVGAVPHDLVDRGRGPELVAAF